MKSRRQGSEVCPSFSHPLGWNVRWNPDVFRGPIYTFLVTLLSENKEREAIMHRRFLNLWHPFCTTDRRTVSRLTTMSPGTRGSGESEVRWKHECNSYCSSINGDTQRRGQPNMFIPAHYPFQPKQLPKLSGCRIFPAL